MSHSWDILEFADAVHGSASKYKAIAVLVGYFDDSGTHADSNLALVGGAIADTTTWGRLERPWRRLLNGLSVPCFHATDCENGEGDFSRLERKFRDPLAWALSDEISKSGPQCFGAGVIRRDWGIVGGELQQTFGDPYYFCVALCLEQIAAWSRQYAEGEPVALVFAQQQAYDAATKVLHAEYFKSEPEIGSMTTGKPQLLIPLQVADFVAYESYRWANDRLTNPDAEMRTLLKNLKKRDGAMDLRLFDRQALERLSASAGAGQLGPPLA